jgi:hypothetical protein
MLAFGRSKTLSVEKSVELQLEDLESIVECSENVPVPEWHLRILAERMAKYGDSTEGFITLEDFLAVRAEVRQDREKILPE